MKKIFAGFSVFAALIALMSLTVYGEGITGDVFSERESEISEDFEDVPHEETTEKEEIPTQETPEYEKGDVNHDGKITAADARIALRIAANLEYADEETCVTADITEDGKITAADARLILRKSAKLENVTQEPDSVKHLIKNVPILGQYPDYPAGCETVAAVMNLNFFGMDITVDDFIDFYLPLGTAPYWENDRWYSSSPEDCFLGDPESDKGWGIWAKGMLPAIENYLQDINSNYGAKVTYSETINSLCEKYVANDVPVMVWVTAYMEEPYANITAQIIGSNETFTWISPNHCMLLVGYDKDGYYFNDPITGELEIYGKEESEIAFRGNGSQAIIITRQG